MAFYLKYRPKKIADFDLAAIRASVTRALQADDFPHALLFAGPRGVGKTSMARLIAKSLNCPNRKGIEPCAECSVCRAIDQGSFLDVLEIDAASNRGIDDIRQLKEKVGLAPSRGEYKVYIIDEVHMLTTQAFNALLKTLEEPPEKVVFILCTTNPEKIPETILSRCMRFNFNKASQEEVVGALKKVVAGEELEIAEEDLKLIASATDGSFRDAQKILEELSFIGKKISHKEAEAVLGQGQALQPQHLLEKIIADDFAGAMEELARLDESGVDLVDFSRRILAQLRQWLHGVWGVTAGGESPADEDELLRLVHLFDRAARQIRSAAVPILPLELAVSEAVQSRPAEAEKADGDGGNNKNETTTKAQSKSASSVKKKSAVAEKEAEGNNKITGQQWQSILSQLRNQNHSLSAFLKSAQPTDLQDNRLTLKVYYRFHKECLERENNRRVVEEAAGKVLGQSVRLFCRFTKKPAPSQSPKKATLAEEEKDDNIYEVAQDIFGGE